LRRPKTERPEKRCEYYEEWTWGEPPLEPDGNGKLITEYDCKIAKGYFVAICGGDVKLCSLPDNQKIQERQNANYNM
jgi:hypothetical protein